MLLNAQAEIRIYSLPPSKVIDLSKQEFFISYHEKCVEEEVVVCSKGELALPLLENLQQFDFSDLKNIAQAKRSFGLYIQNKASQKKLDYFHPSLDQAVDPEASFEKLQTAFQSLEIYQYPDFSITVDDSALDCAGLCFVKATLLASFIINGRELRLPRTYPMSYDAKDKKLRATQNIVLNLDPEINLDSDIVYAINISVLNSQGKILTKIKRGPFRNSFSKGFVNEVFKDLVLN